MKVIVDTSVWSLVLRRGTPQEELRRQLAGLIDEQRVVVLGPIRQELLSGYSGADKFELLRDRLACFENEPILDEDYIRAAEFHNICRSKGTQGSHTDFLICACAVRLEASIFTTDNDFRQFRRGLPITLFPETTQSRS